MTVIVGHINVVDLRGCGLHLLSQITPTLIKKLSSLLEPFPIRIKAIHLVYPPKAIETAFRILSSVAHEKLKNRIYVHENFDELCKQMPHLKNHLPVEFDGTNGKLPQIIADWKKDLLDHGEWFKEDAKYRYINTNNNEQKNGMFGTEGSFRSLDID